MTIFNWVLYFYIYAFLGWCCEVIYCSIPKKKFVNRGFLYSPICPIYGFGAVFVLLILYEVRDKWYLVLILGFFITSILEYITSFLMEKIFHLRWWDYSHHLFNIKGRVCLLNSTLFALLCMGIVYIVHPLIINFVSLFSQSGLIIITSTLNIGIIIDTVFSCIAVGKLNKLIQKYKDIKEEINVIYHNDIRKYIYAHFIMKFPKLQSITHNTAFERIKSVILKSKEEIKELLIRSKK